MFTSCAAFVKIFVRWGLCFFSPDMELVIFIKFARNERIVLEINCNFFPLPQRCEMKYQESDDWRNRATDIDISFFIFGQRIKGNGRCITLKDKIRLGNGKEEAKEKEKQNESHLMILWRGRKVCKYLKFQTEYEKENWNIEFTNKGAGEQWRMMRFRPT